MKALSLCGLIMMFILSGGFQHTANAETTAKKAKPCVSVIHVIVGCSACEAMQEWLKAGGVKLELQNVETGPYKLYPTVVYTDKSTDHGERMYKQEVVIPEKLCVISCSVGTE